jgi:hypothetical protein
MRLLHIAANYAVNLIDTVEIKMNEKQAKQIAKENNLKVSGTKVSILDGRFWWDVPAKRHEIKIGDAVCFYETDRGGCACWEVEFNNEIFARYYKAEAIIKAVELQVK